MPNVVYSCGALLHSGTLVLPYGIGDSAIGVATVPLDELLASLTQHHRLTKASPPMTGDTCLTDHLRSLLERSPAIPSRRSGKQKGEAGGADKKTDRMGLGR